MSLSGYMIVSVINKIIDDLKRTSDDENKWYRLIRMADENNRFENIFLNSYVSEKMAETAKSELFMIYGSYYRKFKDGYIYIFMFNKPYNENKYVLGIQSSSNAKVVELNDIKSLQSELSRAVNLIERQIDDVDSFIKDFISE